MALTDEQVEILFSRMEALTRQLYLLTLEMRKMFGMKGVIVNSMDWRKTTLLNQKSMKENLALQFLLLRLLQLLPDKGHAGVERW